MYIACGSASLYIKTLYVFLTVLALSAAATVVNIKIRYDAKTPQFALFGTRVMCVFYSIRMKFLTDGLFTIPLYALKPAMTMGRVCFPIFSAAADVCVVSGV